MSIGTFLYTLFNGEMVGKDEAGNRYYRTKPAKVKASSPEKRWVVYEGLAEPSKVSPHWHGWLHYTSNVVPTEKERTAFAWEKPHVPNLTGTELAYRPPGHISQGGHRDKATGDYEPWKPA